MNRCGEAYRLMKRRRIHLGSKLLLGRVGTWIFGNQDVNGCIAYRHVWRRRCRQPRAAARSRVTACCCWHRANAGNGARSSNGQNDLFSSHYRWANRTSDPIVWLRPPQKTIKETTHPWTGISSFTWASVVLGNLYWSGEQCTGFIATPVYLWVTLIW